MIGSGIAGAGLADELDVRSGEHAALIVLDHTGHDAGEALGRGEGGEEKYEGQEPGDGAKSFLHCFLPSGSAT